MKKLCVALREARADGVDWLLRYAGDLGTICAIVCALEDAEAVLVGRDCFDNVAGVAEAERHLGRMLRFEFQRV